MTYLLFGCGFLLSAIAAYYAVMGLIAIFSTAVIPIAIMGAALEASKLVSASWLYRNWKTAPKLLLTYFTTAVVVLMVLTSMGIFGYLSKAHLDQAVPTGDIVSKLSLIDEKIKTQKENIDAARKALNQLDAQVDQTLARSSDEKGAANAVAIRQRQARERTNLTNEISKSQEEIAKLNQERAPIAAEVRKVEAEVGPIKYIAALIYGDTMDDSLLESAVRIVILMIVFVFDPLAVLLLIAANREILLRKPEDVNTPSDPLEDPSVKSFFDRAKQTAIKLDKERDEQEKAKWKSIISFLTKNDKTETESSNLNYDPYTGMTVDMIKEKPEEVKWEIPEPPAEPPEEFKKVVKDYFHPENKTNETMLYVNEEPELKFILNPDFDEKDAFAEKKKLIPVRPNSRRVPPKE
jgi:hypothetical protein